MSSKTSGNAILWFRNDLRLHDHPALQAASRHPQLLPVYCFDPRSFEATEFGFPKTGAHRTKFQREGVLDLRDSLRRLGSDLLIRLGEPEVVIPELARQVNAEVVYANAEIAYDEAMVEQQLAKSLNATEIQLYEGNQLYLESELPFTVQQLPDVFGQFRRSVEKHCRIGRPLPPPKALPPLPAELDLGDLPSWKELGLAEPVEETRAVLNFSGGETAGRQRLQEYFWEKQLLSRYKETRNGMLGADYSSKFSPWLATGCLSPRWIHAEIRRYEAKVARNDSTYWMIFELLWREYFRWVGRKYGTRLFRLGGIRNYLSDGGVDELFTTWCIGRTGIPLIDANMRELATTGFMSNRGRQNVASFLVRDLRQDWRAGAEWFQSLLIDYDVCSNWGNWNYVAGIGNDPRENRTFNIMAQAQRYDARGEYVKHWLPELQDVPPAEVHRLVGFTPQERQVRGIEYPDPVILHPAWRKHL
jgi:deoxyribodipyrimidine photo-lyase